MSRPTLTVVGKGEPVVDDGMVNLLRGLLLRAQAGELSGLLVLVDVGDPEPEIGIQGDPLRLLAMYALVSPELAAVALGYDE